MLERSVTRRAALARIGVGAATLGFPVLNLRAQDFAVGDPTAISQKFWERPRWVWLKRQATGEQIRLEYWRDGVLLEESHRQLSWFLRDLRFQAMMQAGDGRIYRALDQGLIGQQHVSPWVLMDPMLLDILYAYCSWLGYFGVQEPLVLTSAFRHLLTNMSTEGAARDSWHVRGGAADLIVPHVDVRALARFGRWLSGGGVGLYANKQFVHVDRGRVRQWVS